MKSDNSRVTFDARKHFSGVRQQQGRVQIDADANEQSDIVNYRIETEAGDVIGLCGAPMHNPAFHIVGDLDGLSPEERALPGNTRPLTGTAKIPTGFAPPDFLISAGRYYVDGILCENEDLISYLTQRDLPKAPPIDEPGLYVVYVDVWQRLLTALDDPSIREVALGGPDTATRTKTVWQVKHWLAVDRSKSKIEDGNCLSSFDVFEDLITPSSGKLSARSKRAETTTDPCVVSPVAGYTGLENQLYRIEIHNGGGALDATAASGASLTRVRDQNAQVKVSGSWTQQAAVEIFSAADPMNGKLAFVKAVEGSKRGTKTLTLDIDVSQLSFSDPLIREVGATFKWSRDNGVVVTPIQSISGAEVTVHDLGPDDALGFKEGQWVELSDDALELNGLPGQLAEISKVDSALNRVTLKIAPDPLDPSKSSGVNKDLHPKLRRWDGVGVLKFDSEDAEDNFVDLESGVQISFSPGTLHTGDYWTVPARTATADTQAGNIDWPVDSSNEPLAQSPFGIEHHYCRLAMLKWDGRKFTFEDCRSLFPPITELTTMVYVSGDGQEAMPGQPIQQPLQVGVFNGRWPVANAQVRFRISSAAGRFGVRSNDPDLDQGQLKSIDGKIGPDTSITVKTGADGIAGCVWQLDPRFGPLVDPSSDRTSQQVEARLLDATGAPTPALVRFDGNLSVADEVAYFPGNCEALSRDKTVQRALDRLSHQVSLYEVSGNNQEVMPRDANKLASLVVLAANRCGPVARQEVTFKVVAGHGKVSPEVATTNDGEKDEGVASCTWELDPTTPRQEVEAKLTGEGSYAATTTVRFVANLSTAAQVAYDPGACALLQPRATVQEALDQLSRLISLYEVSGNNQLVTSQSEMRPLQVLATNKCGPVAGQRISFKVGTKSGSVNPAEAVTNDKGIASTVWTIEPGTTGQQQVEATLIEATPQTIAPPTAVIFNAYLSTADHVLYVPGDCDLLRERGTVQRAIDQLSRLISLYEVSGNNPTAVPGIVQKIQVLAANKCGPVAGQRVNFSLLVAGQGKVEPAQALTDVNGIAAADWTFGSAQNQRVRAALVESTPKSLAAPTSILFNANRSATGGSQAAGCEITVGRGGQFERLDEALTSLLSDEDLIDICLCLLPGDHVTGGLNIERKDLHLKITGCGRGSRLVFAENPDDSFPTGNSVQMTNLTSFTMRDLEVFGVNYFFNFEQCDDVTFANCHLTQEGHAIESGIPPFIIISKADRIRFEGNVISAISIFGEDGAKQPGRAVVLMDAEAETWIEDNQITGVVSLYGPPASTTLKQQELAAIRNALRTGALTFTESRANLRIRNNALYRLTVSDATVAALKIPAGGQRNLNGFYRRCFVTDNSFTGGDNLFVMEHLALNSDTFQAEKTFEAGAVVADATTYVGNYAPTEIRLFDATKVSEKAANAVIRIVLP